MPGVPREEAEHSLDLNEKAQPVKQRLRRFAQDRKEAIRVEVIWFLAAGLIREVTYLEWLANPVLVKKKNGKWRMCVDYTDLNKHCPKDPFPLPRIDQVVDSIAGCAVTPRPTNSTREVENLSDETEELCSSSLFPDLCNTYLELSACNACAVLSK